MKAKIVSLLMKLSLKLVDKEDAVSKLMTAIDPANSDKFIVVSIMDRDDLDDELDGFASGNDIYDFDDMGIEFEDDSDKSKDPKKPILQ